MRRYPSAPSFGTFVNFTLFATFLTLSATAQAQIIVGPNVNMVGAPGYVDPVTGEIINDPTLNRQNEPSHAFSTRNPCHILAGANDYRLVDFETPLIGDERADAWLGVFKSFDCGRTWISGPHPGHPLDLTVTGKASPIYGRQAGADATVRALPGGRFLMSGLAFDRGGIAQVFVSLFEDRNNKDGGDSIDWLGTVVLDSGQSGQFLDKPWIATTKDGTAYIAYTVFLGSGNNIHTQIKVAKFNGTTWSNPQKVSESVARNQGTTIAVDPGTGYVYVAWREFLDPRDSIVVTVSKNGGTTFSKAQRVEPANASGQPYRLSPFDQDASYVTFRTFSYPTMAIVPAVAEGRAANAPGRVYLAWAARGFVPLRNTEMPGQTSNQILGDARIVYSTTTDGTTWTYPKVADNAADAGHQLMPALASAGGKLALAYYDLRADMSLTFDDKVIEYGQAAFDACMAAKAVDNTINVVECMVNDPSVIGGLLGRRHTLDVRAAVADGACLIAGSCNLDSVSALNGNRQVSRYLVAYTNTTTKQGIVQLQFNAPNLPLFKKGSVAFIGDYIDIQGLDYVPDGVDAAGVTRWAWNTGATANSPAPVFMVTWADNRNVRRPGAKGWEQFTRINSAACEPGQAGIRNQDVYSAILKPGLSMSAPLNARRIGDLQRSFPVVIANNTTELRKYRISVVAPPGVVASFDQFAGFGVGAPSTFLDLNIPPRSTATRTLFVLKSDDAAAEHVLVPVVVTEITEPGGLGATDTIFLNPDLDNPDSADSTVDSQEAHVPLLDDPTLQTFTNTPGGFKTPDFDTPDFDTPDFDTPDFDTPDFDTPDFDTPDFDTPDFDTPDFDTPDFDTPDFDTAAVADVSWKVTNTGNVTSAYKPNINIQDGKIGTRYQLVVRVITVQSLTNAANALSCKPGLMPQNQMLVNIVDPNVQSKLVGLNSSDFNDPDKKNATFTLGSHQSAVITLRAYCQKSQNGVPIPGVNAPGGCAVDGPLPLTASGKPLVSASSVAQAANCQTCTGSSCDLLDFVGRGTMCTLDDGLPKDVYDPIPPKFGPAPSPTANDVNNPPGSETVTFTLNVTDNVAVNSVSCDLGTVTPGSYSVTGTFPVGTTVVTCSATDGSGNTADLTVNVVVKDVTPPTIDFHANVTAEATSGAGAVVNYTYPATADAVDGPKVASCAPVSGSTFPLGNTTITCTATDAAGNAATATTFVVGVIDTTAPNLTVPANITKYATGLTGAVVTYSAVGTDAVDASVTVVCTPPTGSTFPIGTTTVSCTATDDYSNATTRGFTVTIIKLEYVFVAVQNLPPPAGKTFKPGSAVPLKWQFKADGVDSTAALPAITITGPTGVQVFTASDPGKSSFQPPTAANNWTWQFNWQTSAANGTNLPAGSYNVSITSQQTGQTFSGGTIVLK